MKKSSTHANKALNKAKIAQNDVFMTREQDIRNEILHSGAYDESFRGKAVLCNCNDANRSGFEQFFEKVFSVLGLKELITVSYIPDGTAVAIRFNGNNKRCIQLTGTGDYQSSECIELMDECDIVCTNPPFSIFRSFVKTVIEHGKLFLLIGNINEMMCNDLFPLFKEGKIWFGQNQVKMFDTLEGERKFGNVGWFTNMGVRAKARPIEMNCSYEWNHRGYPKYDNYDGIDVNKLKNLPYDYDGNMGVPGTYLLIHNPDQFELIDTSSVLAGPIEKEDGKVCKHPGAFYINENRMYGRVIIRRKCAGRYLLSEESSMWVRPYDRV